MYYMFLLTVILRFLFQLRRDIDEFYKKYFTTDETRYNEVMFVVDHLMVSCYKTLTAQSIFNEHSWRG